MSYPHPPAFQLGLWPSSRLPERVLFHSDFDGICSAALLRRFFAREDLVLEPVDYGIRGSWLRRRLGRAAVVDFLYHPEALWWFDHHATSFLEEGLRGSYRPGPRHRWDPSYPSCPPLILDVLGESEDVSSLGGEFEEWIHWCNIIDAAGYESPHQATRGEEPCLLINQALSESPDPELRRRLVVEISAGTSPGNLAGRQEIQELWASYRSKVDEALTAIGERLQQLGDVGFCDITDRGALFLRYGVYCFLPQARFSVTAYNAQKGRQPYKISLSYNPWLAADDNPLNLGQLAREHGGGGRESVGSVAFSSSRECSLVAESLARRLERESSSPQAGDPLWLDPAAAVAS